MEIRKNTSKELNAAFWGTAKQSGTNPARSPIRCRASAPKRTTERQAEAGHAPAGAVWFN